MSDKFIRNQVLGTLDIDNEEAKADIQKKIKQASAGAFPYAIREMMKEYAWSILSSDASESRKEDARLLICYAWWARALENDIPKKHFEEFVLDHLQYLREDRRDDSVNKKWSKYNK